MCMNSKHCSWNSQHHVAVQGIRKHVPAAVILAQAAAEAQLSQLRCLLQQGAHRGCLAPLSLSSRIQSVNVQGAQRAQVTAARQELGAVISHAASLQGGRVAGRQAGGRWDVPDIPRAEPHGLPRFVVQCVSVSNPVQRWVDARVHERTHFPAQQHTMELNGCRACKRSRVTP